MRDGATLARIRKLAIPPAWTDVWIAADPRAHIQATGRDARGRKQYRYHAEWTEKRGAEKFLRMAAFARALLSIRARIRRDMGAGETSRAQVLALLAKLLESTFVRVGNLEYKRTNGSYGLTTLEDRHAHISGSTIRLTFRGKGGKQREVQLRDRRLARLVKRCRDVRGQHLFQYLDANGRRRPARSRDLNDYIADIADEHFTAKDFRTWGASLTQAGLLDRRGEIVLGVPGRSAMREDLKAVADQLGNTPAVCRKSYVHPYLLQAYEDEAVWRAWRRTAKGRARAGLGRQESRLLRFLETWSTASQRSSRQARPRGRAS